MSGSNKFGLRWKIRVFAAFGFLMALVLFGGVVSLFLIEIEDTIYASGKVMPELPYEIVGHVDGRVVKLVHQEGDDVKQGEVIAVVDSLQYEDEYVSISSTIKDLEAELEVKKAELAILEREPLPKDLWYAETNYKERSEKANRTSDRLARYMNLDKLSAISKKDFETAEIDNIQAQAELSRAKEVLDKVKSGIGEKYLEKMQRDVDLVRAKLDGSKAALNLTAKHIAECKLVAPAAGRIVELPCKYTMYVERGKIAAKLATGLSLKGIAYVDERVVRKVRPGQDVRISSGVFNRLEFGSFHGVVDRIKDVPEGVAASGSAKYPVEIIVDPEGRELKLGSSAEFAIVTGHEPVIYSFLGITKEDFKHPPRDVSRFKVAKPAASQAEAAQDDKDDQAANAN